MSLRRSEREKLSAVGYGKWRRGNADILCIDFRQDGIGSNSCGPELAEKYRFQEEEFNFSFGLRIQD